MCIPSSPLQRGASPLQGVWQRGGVFLFASLESVGPSDIARLFPRRLVEAARDYVEQDRLALARRLGNTLAARLYGWSDQYEVRLSLERGELVGQCSDGRSRCRHVAALLYAWVHRRDRFLDIAAQVEAALPSTLRAAVASALVAEDPLSPLLSRLGTREGEEPRALATPALLEAYFSAPDPDAYFTELVARLDRIAPEEATFTFLAHLFQNLAFHRPTGELCRRFLRLFPEGRTAELLTDHGLIGLPEAVAVLRAGAAYEAARLILELALLTELPAAVEKALLVEGVALAERQPLRRRRYLERLLLLGEREWLPAWLELTPEAAERRAMAERLAERGNKALAVHLLLRAGMAGEAKDLADLSVPAEVLLELAEALPPKERVSLAHLLLAKADEAGGRIGWRLQQLARGRRGEDERL